VYEIPEGAAILPVWREEEHWLLGTGYCP
jgi:hypothetical protein